jgi:hypothetical protein
MGPRDASIAGGPPDVLKRHANHATKVRRMTNARTAVTTALVVGSLVIGLPGCQKAEGPAERASKGIDKAVESAGQQIEKTGRDIQDAAKDAKK